MHYLSIDLETTGRARHATWCQILEIGVVYDCPDLAHLPVQKLPHFHCLVRHERIQGEPFALAMNARLLEYLHDEAKCPFPVLPANEVVPALVEWLNETVVTPEPLCVAGKNFGGFDLAFLRELPHWKDWYGSCIEDGFDYRFFDVGNLWANPDDKKVPNLAECLRRAQRFNPSLCGTVTHDALDDARQVVELMRAWQNLEVA